jgi:hypothetical protein
MKKLHVAMLSLVALVAFSALVGTASAETTLLAEWLLNGAGVTTLTSTEGTGKLILEDAKIGLAMECEGTLDGSVGANGEDEITEVLVAGVAITLPNTIVCKGIGGCGAPAEASPEHLPWHTLLYLTEAGGFRDEIVSATYWSMCTILGFLVEEECTITGGSYPVTSGTAGVEPSGEVTPLGTCTTGGTASAAQKFVTGDLLKSLTGILSVSE